MTPLRRYRTIKQKSARKFRAHTGKTKAANMNQVTRGGIRF